MKSRLCVDLVRVRNLEALFGAEYEWDGGCQCGSQDWEDGWWEGGWSARCRRCGHWVCYHEIGSVAHTSEGKWAPYPHNRKPRPPSGCPLLTEGAVEPPGGVQNGSVRTGQGVATGAAQGGASGGVFGAR